MLHTILILIDCNCIVKRCIFLFRPVFRHIVSVPIFYRLDRKQSRSNEIKTINGIMLYKVDIFQENY